MSTDSWTDRIVGERMAVDREFSSRVAASRFTSQEWGLIMTATEFEIENATDPEAARIVAETSKVDHILPELENVRSQVGAMGGDVSARSESGGGVIDSIKGVLGIGGSGGDRHAAERDAAEELTQEYARQLQEHLESTGRWESVRTAAAEEGDARD